MSALETIDQICNCSLIDADLRYCLVSKDKLPFKSNDTIAKINEPNDFVELSELLQCKDLTQYAGVGISIQASNICAIDVDHCFSRPFDLTSQDERATDILSIFNAAYCEFSFSGTGLRILFQADIIENYSDQWYIKNSKASIEYYQPFRSFRYVTITGRSICNNNPRDHFITSEELQIFLNKYMLKTKRKSSDVHEMTSEYMPIQKLINKIKYLYLTNAKFQDLWFGIAPGSGKNESELDYALLSYIYEEITQYKEQVKELFEMSPYFKSKDSRHIYKWNYQDFRYFNYVYDSIKKFH